MKYADDHYYARSPELTAVIEFVLKHKTKLPFSHTAPDIASEVGLPLIMESDATEAVQGLIKWLNVPENIDEQAVEVIREQTGGKDLRLNLDNIGENKLNTAQRSAAGEMDVQAVYDAYMTNCGTRISDFKGGKATVTVPYALKQGQVGRGVTVWYIADNGDKTQMPADKVR